MKYLRSEQPAHGLCHLPWRKFPGRLVSEEELASLKAETLRSQAMKPTEELEEVQSFCVRFEHLLASEASRALCTAPEPPDGFCLSIEGIPLARFGGHIYAVVQMDTLISLRSWCQPDHARLRELLSAWVSAF